MFFQDVTLPVYQVLNISSTEARAQKTFNHKHQASMDEVRRRGGVVGGGLSRTDLTQEKKNVKRILIVQEKVQMDRLWASDLCDGEGPDESGG